VRKIIVGIAGVTLVAGGLAVVAPIAFAQTPAQVQASDAPERIPSDDLPSPLGDKQRALTQEAVSGVLNGSLHTEQRGNSTVVKVGSSATANGRGGVVRKLFNHKDQYVELSRERTDKIFVILVQFGDQVHPSYPANTDTDPNTPGPVRFDGPLKNQIPQPDRALDNSTVWQSDYNRQHFQDLYFGNGESLKKYYEAQSSGRYSVDGTVTDWVKVNFNEARYGRSNGFPCASQVCSNTWLLVRDAANQWVADQLAAGRMHLTHLLRIEHRAGAHQRPWEALA
jgi:immune inhibitor A